MKNLGTALITGASSGIGAVYADRLAARGYDLILTGRDQANLEQVAARQAATGRKISTIRADLTRAADLAVVEQRLREDSSITALVNNAGLGATKPLLESSAEAMSTLIDINVTALTRLGHAAMAEFAARRNGTIINIASIAALAPEILNGVYSASKSYVMVLSQSMHHELKDKGVRVQAVLPGATSTPFWDRAGLPVQHLPSAIVMTAEDMVDAALAGLDLGELVTVPALPDGLWDNFNNARLAMANDLSGTKPAARYR
ncbi:SDR family NAD(P)-dependent oxidoreductase [Oxalobacteraceae bacterium A2-2]